MCKFRSDVDWFRYFIEYNKELVEYSKYNYLEEVVRDIIDVYDNTNTTNVNWIINRLRQAIKKGAIKPPL